MANMDPEVREIIKALAVAQRRLVSAAESLAQGEMAVIEDRVRSARRQLDKVEVIMSRLSLEQTEIAVEARAEAESLPPGEDSEPA